MLGLTARIQSLAQCGVKYVIRPALEEDTFSRGEILRRFDGEGLEMILPFDGKYPNVELGITEENYLYKLLKTEIGEVRARKSFEYGVPELRAIMEIEEHVILDFAMGMKYQFKMPSRKYANPLFNHPYQD